MELGLRRTRKLLPAFRPDQTLAGGIAKQLRMGNERKYGYLGIIRIDLQHEIDVAPHIGGTFLEGETDHEIGDGQYAKGAAPLENLSNLSYGTVFLQQLQTLVTPGLDTERDHAAAGSLGPQQRIVAHGIDPTAEVPGETVIATNHFITEGNHPFRGYVEQVVVKMDLLVPHIQTFADLVGNRSNRTLAVLFVRHIAEGTTAGAAATADHGGKPVGCADDTAVVQVADSGAIGRRKGVKIFHIRRRRQLPGQEPVIRQHPALIALDRLGCIDPSYSGKIHTCSQGPDQIREGLL